MYNLHKKITHNITTISTLNEKKYEWNIGLIVDYASKLGTSPQNKQDLLAFQWRMLTSFGMFDLLYKVKKMIKKL